jgi:hypothetical protein
MKKVFNAYNEEYVKEYVGELKDGLPHGQGAITYNNGDKYVGKFKDGELDGQGTYTFGDGPNKGDKYVGEYKDAKRHGKGTYTFEDGKVLKGTWIDDKFVDKSLN